MNAVPLPAGYHWSFGQNFDRDDDAGKKMGFNLLVALVLVYVVMCAMFESLIYPAAILTTFVFSIFGVFWLFWITGTTLSIMAWIGVLILMGVVVNNGIVMIVHINQLRHQGMPRREALIQGAKDRLRPILMTMGTAILGMVPLCISDAGDRRRRPAVLPDGARDRRRTDLLDAREPARAADDLFAARRCEPVGQGDTARCAGTSNFAHAAG